jgi:nitrite reductase/ring-hydroxylating ferredoxin subunit/uncharacterized membrane protein YphA (DoxX/SURF4 family)
MATSTGAIARSWNNQPIATSILRLWLGITWIYAGWNKATDAGFLNQASPHYIGAQLAGYLKTSPISFILRKMIEHATLIGWGTMVLEFAIGFAILAGFSMQLTSLVAFGLSAVLWLSATWSVKPYFLGSDTAYMVLWAVLFFLVRDASRDRRISAIIGEFTERRNFVRLIGVGIAGIAASVAGSKFRARIATPEAGSSITTVASFPVGSTMTFTAADGSPAVLFRTAAGVFAYSAICTHQGCTVAYDSGSHLLACPCHGAQFDPTKNAAVVQGPAQSPLASIKVAIKGANIVQI